MRTMGRTLLERYRLDIGNDVTFEALVADIDRAVVWAVDEEREACAQVAENDPLGVCDARIAARIRERSELVKYRPQPWMQWRGTDTP